MDPNVDEDTAVADLDKVVGARNLSGCPENSESHDGALKGFPPLRFFFRPF
jgi:hypothetical protein